MMKNDQIVSGCQLRVNPEVVGIEYNLDENEKLYQ